MNNSTEQIAAGIKSLNQKLGVISTASIDGKPESAVVYFSSDDNLNIYFTTRSDNRKYKNISANPRVSFVIFSENPPETIQIEGIATAITDPDEQAALFSETVARAAKNNAVPPIDKISESEIMFIRIAATWARLGNFEIEKNGDIFTEVSK